MVRLSEEDRGSARRPGPQRGGGWGGEDGDVVPRMVSDTRVLCNAEDGSAEDDKCHEGIWRDEGG